MKKKILKILIVMFSVVFSGECLAEELDDGCSDKKSTLTAVVNPDFEPYISFSEGNSEGIVPDIISLIKQNLGVDIKIVEADSSEQYFTYVQSDEFDLILDIAYNKGKDFNDSYYTSKPYVFVNYSRLILRDSGADDFKVSVYGEKSLGALYVSNFFSQDQIKYYDSLDECLMAISNGECSDAVINSLLAEKTVNYDTENKYIETRINGASQAVSIGVSKRLGPDFYDRLNNSIEELRSDEVTDVISKYSYYIPIENEEDDGLYYNTVMIFMTIGSISLVIAFAASINFFVKRQKIAKDQKELLQNALAKTENASNAKGQFLARMSHEIRTPMNAIAGFVALAKDKTYDSEAVMRYLDEIETASDILLRLINDILDVSAIESNKFTISNVKFDLLEVLNETASMYYEQCSYKNVSFDMDISDVTEDVLVGDSLRLNQILFNLLSNSVKFTEEGGSIKLNVVQTSKTDDKVYIKFIVSDTGCGMSNDMMSRIFKPFEQENTYYTRKYGGSGLGLSIVKSLVEMMHGAISVDSKKGIGTTFTVDLPFGISDEVIERHTGKLNDVNAVVISNDMKNMKNLEQTLKKIGIEFDAFECTQTNSERVLIAVKNSDRHYDVCFVDCEYIVEHTIYMISKMRRMSGNEMVIVVSASVFSAEAEDRVLSAGADMCIVKPIYQSTVFNIVVSLSGKKNINAASVSSQYDFTGYKVLMAEDNALNRDITVSLLERVNLTIDCACDGKEAVDMFVNSQKGEYSLILMDVQMPIMDGYEAARMIRTSQHPDAKSIPIYAMTANVFTEDVSAALSSGMNGHIAKPIDTKALYNAIKDNVSDIG